MRSKVQDSRARIFKQSVGGNGSLTWATARPTPIGATVSGMPIGPNLWVPPKTLPGGYTVTTSQFGPTISIASGGDTVAVADTQPDGTTRVGDRLLFEAWIRGSVNSLVVGAKSPVATDMYPLVATSPDWRRLAWISPAISDAAATHVRPGIWRLGLTSGTLQVAGFQVRKFITP